jgi:acyl-ACP thioesterase
VELVEFPGTGRRFVATARVRFGDTDPRARMRLDALARVVQDVGNDDLADAGFDPMSPWVVRRASLWAPDGWPTLGEPLEVSTFCSGLGGRWGERRTSLRSPTATVEVAAVWIFLDGQGRPAPLTGPFLEVYRPSANGRGCSSRLRHPPVPPGAEARAWPLRASDLDIFGHVNNSAVWMAVEDQLARSTLFPSFAEVEYHAPIDADDDLVLRSELDATRLGVWLTCAGRVRASAVVVAHPPIDG